MPTSVRLDRETENAITRLARKTGRTRSDVIRDAIALFVRSGRAGTPPKTPYEAMAHLIGSIKGAPPDLSERTGEKFRKLLLERSRK